MKRNVILYLAAAAAVLAGCAKEVSTDTQAAAKKYFEAWQATHYPEAVEAGNGIFILEEQEGDGEVISVANEPYVAVDFTITDLEGNVTSTTYEDIAKRIGTYDAGNTYGARFWWDSDDYYGVYAGVEDLLEGMKVGGHRKAAIPYWLFTQDRYTKRETYLKKVTTGSNAIYDVTVRSICADINKYQGDQMDAYAKAYLDGADSTHIAGNEELQKFGFYFVSKGIAREKDLEYEMPGDTTLYLNYTGKLLNGKVFDTTIANVAKDAGIYSKSRTYEPVKISRSSTYTDITMGSDSSDLVDGFQAAIYMLHPMEKAVTVFYSELGYGSTGSGMVIPPYSPLVFELELVEKPE